MFTAHSRKSVTILDDPFRVIILFTSCADINFPKFLSDKKLILKSSKEG